jgi:hypothetical protein
LESRASRGFPSPVRHDVRPEDNMRVDIDRLIDTILGVGFLLSLLFTAIRGTRLRRLYRESQGSDRDKFDQLLQKNRQLAAEVKPLSRKVIIASFATIVIALWILFRLTERSL